MDLGSLFSHSELDLEQNDLQELEKRKTEFTRLVAESATSAFLEAVKSLTRRNQSWKHTKSNDVRKKRKGQDGQAAAVEPTAQPAASKSPPKHQLKRKQQHLLRRSKRKRRHQHLHRQKPARQQAQVPLRYPRKISRPPVSRKAYQEKAKSPAATKTAGDAKDTKQTGQPNILARYTHYLLSEHHQSRTSFFGFLEVTEAADMRLG